MPAVGQWLAEQRRRVGGPPDRHADMYGVDLERGIAELVLEATSFRFDGFGPDAGRGWRWFLLDRHDRLRQRSVRPGYGLDRDRRLLAVDKVAFR